MISRNRVRLSKYQFLRHITKPVKEKGALAEILRCLILEKRFADLRQARKLLAEAEKAGDLPATQLYVEQTDSHRLALAVRRALEYPHLQVKLRADQERLDRLENSMSEVVWQVHPDLHFQDVTHSICQLTGFDQRCNARCH